MDSHKAKSEDALDKSAMALTEKVEFWLTPETRQISGEREKIAALHDAGVPHGLFHDASEHSQGNHTTLREPPNQLSDRSYPMFLCFEASSGRRANPFHGPVGIHGCRAIRATGVGTAYWAGSG